MVNGLFSIGYQRHWICLLWSVVLIEPLELARVVTPIQESLGGESENIASSLVTCWRMVLTECGL